MSNYLPFKTLLPVVGIHEHTRTISGRRDPVTGAVALENISLGYFMHLQWASGNVDAYHLGPTAPDDLKAGDTVEITFRKAEK